MLYTVYKPQSFVACVTLRRTLVTCDTKCFHPTFHQSTITERPAGGSRLLNTVFFFFKTGVRAKEETLVDILPMRVCVWGVTIVDGS